MGIQSLEIGGPHNPEVHPSADSVKKVLICDLKVENGEIVGKTIARNVIRRAGNNALVDFALARRASVIH
jgi:hypothetical protein